MISLKKEPRGIEHCVINCDKSIRLSIANLANFCES